MDELSIVMESIGDYKTMSFEELNDAEMNVEIDLCTIESYIFNEITESPYATFEDVSALEGFFTRIRTGVKVMCTKIGDAFRILIIKIRAFIAKGVAKRNRVKIEDFIRDIDTKKEFRAAAEKVFEKGPAGTYSIPVGMGEKYIAELMKYGEEWRGLLKALTIRQERVRNITEDNIVKATEFLRIGVIPKVGKLRSEVLRMKVKKSKASETKKEFASLNKFMTFIVRTVLLRIEKGIEGLKGESKRIDSLIKILKQTADDVDNLSTKHIKYVNALLKGARYLQSTMGIFVNISTIISSKAISMALKVIKKVRKEIK